ncbi:MAG: FHA domain-containing protein [Deltaproteobacteria bacterium]|nr:FHA domain-containing protein [Deltaproteobacteria bacterium]
MSVQDSSASSSSAESRPHAFRLVSQNADPAFKMPPFSLMKGVSFAGRLQSCELTLPGTLVSRRHAKFLVSENGVTIHDLDSHNGIFINGTKVRSSELTPGDQLYFANVCFKVEEIDFVKDGFHNTKARDSILDDNLDQGTAERGLAALVRTADLMSIDDDEIFFNEVMRLLTEMSNAQFSALMRMLPGEGLQKSVTARAPGQLDANTEVYRPAVESAMGSRTAVWSRAQGLPKELLSGQPPILCLPILAAPRVLGAIYVQRRSLIPFSQADVDTVTAVSQMLAIRMTGNVGGAAIGEATQIGDFNLDTQESPKNASQLQELGDDVATLNAELLEKNEALEDQLRGAASVGAKLMSVERELEEANAARTLLQDSQAQLQKEMLETDEKALQSSSLETALIEAIPPRFFAHIQKTLEDKNGTRDLLTSAACALSVQMAGFDGWTGTAPLDVAQKRLDLFCRTVRTLATANHGVVEQVFGHTHLLLFPGDADGVRKALVCAKELLATVPQEGNVGTQAAVHLGTNLSGFFGDALQSAYLQAGDAVAVSRGALESPVAQAGSILVTESVRTMLAGDADYTLVTLGPSFIKGFSSPFSLYQLVGGT